MYKKVVIKMILKTGKEIRIREKFKSHSSIICNLYLRIVERKNCERGEYYSYNKMRKLRSYIFIMVI